MSLALILGLASGAANILGAVAGGQAERAQAREDARRAKEQAGYQVDDITRSRDASEGSLIANASALGVGGDSVDMMKGATIGEYNRAIYRIQQQSDYAMSDLADFEKQSRFNQSVGIGSSILTTGVNYYSHKAQLDLDKKFKGLGIE